MAIFRIKSNLPIQAWNNMRKGLSPSDRARAQEVLMKELVTACLGDKAKAIRLIEYERKLNPALKTLEATESALDRLCYDRGKAKREATYDPKVFRQSHRKENSSASWEIQKEQGPPSVSMTMILSVMLACAVVFGFASIASKSLLRKDQPVPQSKLPHESASPQPQSIPKEETITNITPRESDSYTEPSRSNNVFKCIVNGKTIYSDAHCGNGSSATRLTLPDSAGFVSPPKERLEDLVARRVASEREYERSIQMQTVATPAQTIKMECDALSKHIKWIEAMARQPQTGQMQDWLKDEKVRVQSRESELRC